MNARLDGEIFGWNFVRVVVVDVSLDALDCHAMLPLDCYPVVHESWVPRAMLANSLPEQAERLGLLYHWHAEHPADGSVVVGAVARDVLGQNEKTLSA